jgi:hypothetical protein
MKEHKARFKSKKQGLLVNAPGLALIQNCVSEVFDLSLLCWLLELQLRVVYRKMHKYETLIEVQCMGCKAQYDA